MDKVEASVQHVSIFRLRNVYLIGVLYDFETDNQEGTITTIVQGNGISFWIDKPKGNKQKRTGMATVSVHIISESDPIPMFRVSKGKDTEINIPVFVAKAQDALKIAGELSPLSSTMKQTLSVIPTPDLGLPADVIADLGIDPDRLAAAREWGWAGW